MINTEKIESNKKNNIVLVTGANGHLGFNITKKLVEKGYSVRAGVRNSNNASKIKPLLELKVEIVELDVLNKNDVEKALKDVDAVFHTAAVVDFTLSKKQTIGPTVNGTMNVLEKARDYNINKIIYISSSATLGNGTKDSPVNDSSWDTETKVPYNIAKIEAEKKAWDFVRKNNLNMISICPSMILGPNFYRLTPSTEFLYNIVKGKFTAIPPLEFNMVDVRDVAEIAIRAYENNQSEGRYLVSTEPRSIEEIMISTNKIKKINIPKRKISKRMFISYSYLSKFFASITFRKAMITPTQAKEYVNGVLWTDITKTGTTFDWKPISFENTLHDTINWIDLNF